ncbi:DUF1616 domain-containing protein [Halalkalicoccus subterraneus]|uniref:DUF1616 domain-containing protein n=1 Tax=Halalkalicoccus subterraneus TaxID=2675002 RepID=UPI000EFAF75F|nr:DUF1616 domain-containing protein [Halalkalicoccus subterraneus]
MQDIVEEHVGSSSLWQVPADLIAVGLCVVVVSLTALPVVEGTPFRTVVRVGFVGFVPGYALVAALFPHAATASGAETARFQIGRLERAAVSIAASCGLLLLVGRGLSLLSVAGSSVVIGILGALTIAFAAIGTFRRLALPPAERFGRSVESWLDDLDSRRPVRSGGLLSSIVIGLVVLFVLSSVAYAMVPVQPNGHTELYLLQDGGDGPVSEEYPDELTVGEEQSLIVGVGNEEGTQTSYTVVVQLQEIETDGSQTSVQSVSELDRFDVTLRDGETVENEHVVTPDRAGENLRLTYLLYTGEPPDSPDGSEAYRSAYIWVDVTESEG